MVGGQTKKLRKNIIVNTQHCRTEIDTIQYVVKKYGYKESRDAQESNLNWYGHALRDHDIDLLKNRVCLVNRYPLMDVSLFFVLKKFSILQRKTFFA